jgi:hypothetical protein
MQREPQNGRHQITRLKAYFLVRIIRLSDCPKTVRKQFGNHDFSVQQQGKGQTCVGNLWYLEYLQGA